jgi:hypothetical protein
MEGLGAPVIAGGGGALLLVAGEEVVDEVPAAVGDAIEGDGEGLDADLGRSWRMPSRRRAVRWRRPV